MGSTASANKERTANKSKKADASPVNSPVFDEGATNVALSTATAPGILRPRTRADLAGAAEFNELGALGKVTNDLAMGFGMKPKDDSYDFRTAATLARNAEKNRSKIGDVGYESKTNERAGSQSIMAKVAPTKTVAAAALVDTAETISPPDPDTLPVGEAEAEVLETVPKLGKKSTIATSSKGLETNTGRGLLRKKRSLMGMIK